MTINQHRLLGLLATGLFLLLLLSMFTGSQTLPLYQALSESLAGSDSIPAIILTEVRLPRSLIALFAGATLGLCGAVMQSLLRNPLASPGLVGSASGAVLGAVVALYFGLAGHWPGTLPLSGILGSLGATLLAYLLAGRNGGTLSLILAGVAINAFALALVSLLLNLAPSPYAVQEIALWMLGSLANSSLQDLWILLPGTLLGWLLLMRLGQALDLLSLGEETSQSMGVDLPRLRRRVFLAVALAVGSAVSVTGAIGFIGLVVPHLLRPLTGHRPSRLLAASALGGAILLLAADIVVRLLPAQTEIKVGVLTSLIGAPFFLYLIIQHRRSHA
ncbi:MAG: iron ABC transporter permease [Gammaproteobacteria bacterium]|nr:iron ABC transporter permease [Gammaproteobacteria bacterium]